MAVAHPGQDLLMDAELTPGDVGGVRSGLDTDDGDGSGAGAGAGGVWRAQRRGPIDLLLVAVTAVLVLLGFVAVYSGSAFRAANNPNIADDMYYVKQQLQGALVGLGALVLLMRVDYRWYRRLALFGLLLSAVLILLTQAPGIGLRLNGAARWLVVGGVTFQPAELGKIAVAVFMARAMDKPEINIRQWGDLYAHYGVLILLICVPLMLQPDFGSTVVVLTIASMTMFVAGVRVAHTVPLFFALVVLALGLVFTEGYRMARVATWFRPWEDPDGRGYQLTNAWVALARGGVDGTGFGEGFGGFGYVPELYNDFVAAVIGEEFGFVGIVVIALLFVVFIWRGYTIALNAVDRFGRYLAFALTSLIGLQALINLCVVMGVVPTKGLTLPLVSYGRSSLILTLAVVGVLLNISQRNPDVRGEEAEQRRRHREERELAERQRAYIEGRKAALRGYLGRG